jgi:hypothetical protein
MKKHLKYLKYVIKHKFYVFQECFKLGIPLAGIWHDWSKFLPSEWIPYSQYFYGKPYGEQKTQQEEDAFDRAWLYHQNRSPHHWQYWVLIQDEGNTIVMPMPDRYRREMLADWRGAGRAMNGKDDTKSWYLKNRNRINLHPETRHWIEQQLGIVW